MQRTSFFVSLSFPIIQSVYLFCRVMWIIINVNANMMHISIFICFGFALFIVFVFWGGCYVS